MTHDPNPHAIAGVTTATALLAEAVATVRVEPLDTSGLWEMADKVRAGDHERETIVALAGLAGELVHVVAGLRCEPVAQVLDFLAGCVSESVAEEEN